ncbi:MAG: hypothetical protein WA347_03145 [Rhabdochlamydiaceae bacterium]|jgi:hypothetical protein
MLAYFAERSEVFNRAYTFAKAWQECKKLNSNFAKFVMTNLASWSDKYQVSGDAANPLAFLLQKTDGQSKDIGKLVSKGLSAEEWRSLRNQHLC